MSKQPYIGQSQRDEHEREVNAKRSLLIGYDADTLTYNKAKVTSDGKLAVDATVTIGDITVSGADGSITDGVDSGIKATVNSHGADYALVTHTPDMSLIDTISGINDYAELDIHGMGSCLCQVGGTWSGKVEFQGAIDGIWNTLSIFKPTGAITRNGIQNDSQNGLYRIVITSGYTKIRAILTNWSSGTVNIQFNASNPVGSSQVWQLNQSNLLGTMYQGGNWSVSDRFSVNDIEEASATVTYIGMEDSSGSWYIKQIDTTTGTVFSHATVLNNAGVASYSAAWTDRATLTYGAYSTAF